MGKELSEMTLAELWELFPIFLVQHDDKWKNYYKEIEASIKGIPKKALRIRFITFISDIPEIMMNCISATI